MGQAFLKPIIHAKLLDLARNGPFYRVDYKPNTGKAGATMGILDAPNNIIIPSSVSANETRSRYGDKGNRRTLIQERISWSWDLLCDFPCEVSSERFEALFASEAGMIVPPQQANGNLPALPALRFNLIENDYEHPPQTTSGNSRITFHFDVITGRA